MYNLSTVGASLNKKHLFLRDVYIRTNDEPTVGFEPTTYCLPRTTFAFDGAEGEIRTRDRRFTKPLLYR